MTYTTWREAQTLFDSQVIRDSQEHSQSVYPNESVGIVVDGKYIPVDNTHEDPLNHFKIHPDILVEYHDKIEAVIHSHDLTRHPAGPSKADMISQKQWNIPFGIQLINAAGPGNIIWFGDQLPIPELEGRPYIFGVYDCYSVLRDYYKMELGVDMPNFNRNEDFFLNGDDLYMDNAEDTGFVQVDINDIQKNDIILICIRSKMPNHGLIYLGGDSALHHLPYKTSMIDSVSKYIDPSKKLFHSVWRYKEN